MGQSIISKVALTALLVVQVQAAVPGIEKPVFKHTEASLKSEASLVEIKRNGGSARRRPLMRREKKTSTAIQGENLLHEKAAEKQREMDMGKQKKEAAEKRALDTPKVGEDSAVQEQSESKEQDMPESNSDSKCSPLSGCCPAGYYNRRRGTTCIQCNGELTRRRFNSYGSTFCSDCPVGKVNQDNSDYCQEKECPDGEYLEGDEMNCASCSGAVRRRRADECTPCLIGQYDTEGDDCVIVNDPAAGGTCSDPNPNLAGDGDYHCANGLPLSNVDTMSCTGPLECNRNCCEDFTYEVKLSGTCTTPISTEAECEAAATHLGLSDPTATEQDTWDRRRRNTAPPGCWQACYSSGCYLFLNTRDITEPEPCTDTNQCVCKEPPPPPPPEACGQACAACGFDRCLTCKNEKYLSVAGMCVDKCPPGYIEQGTEDMGRTCQHCDGHSRRRRSANTTDIADTCETCQKGWINTEDGDDCQNLQDTCHVSDCNVCAACMDELREPLGECIQSSDENCFHYGNTWCGSLMTSLNQCEGVSLGCFYKILCHSPCVCSMWKDEHCGGQTGGDNETCIVGQSSDGDSQGDGNSEGEGDGIISSTGNSSIEEPTPAPTAAPTPAPTSAPTPTPPPVIMPVMNSGQCTVQGSCVQSPNYPSHYDAYESCSFTMSPQAPINVVAFDTESKYDKLFVNSNDYSGTTGPEGVTPTGELSWTSDVAHEVSGWKLCQASASSASSLASLAASVRRSSVKVDPPSMLDDTVQGKCQA